MKRNLKYIKIVAKVILSACLVMICAFRSYGQSYDKNHIRARTPRTPIKTSLRLEQLTPMKDSVDVDLLYFDGLGRPLQSVQQAASPNGKDMVQANLYDAFGRQAKKYLPYTTTTSTGNYKDNAFDPNSGATIFYHPAGSSGPQQSNGIVNTTRPYAVTLFEASPLNRADEQGGAGFAWQPEQGHSVKKIYSTNGQTVFNKSPITNNPGSNRVALYTASINANQSRSLNRAASNTANYGSGQLFLTIIKDENRAPTDGCLSSTEEYKDKEGRLVLKRTYNKLFNPGAVQQLSTYYVYDDMGNLSFVLPPGANPDTAAAISTATLNSLCYQYRYDERNRMTGKKLPGKSWEYMVYNKLDQLVARQDSSLRQDFQWEVTKYDNLGRVILVGLWTKSTPGFTAAVYRDSVYANPQRDTRNSTGTGTGYTVLSYPKTFTSTMKINYYDDYNNIPSFPAHYTNSIASKMTEGLLTASRTAILNDPTIRLWKVYYYDDEGRNSRTFSQHYLGAVANTFNYDDAVSVYNFTGQATKITRRHYIKNSAGDAATLAITVNDSLTYDHQGRSRQHWHQLANGTSTPLAKVLVTQNDYNEIGQVLRKNLHSINSGTSFLQAVNYRYNSRNWMVLDSAQLFVQQLKYEDGVIPQYNGNISSQRWLTSGGVMKTADYTYDKLNRLTSGIGSDGNSEKGITYDRMGNFLTLSRFTSGGRIDSLLYHYPNGGMSNQPDTIRDLSGNLTEGAKFGTMAYTYSGNGYVKKDGRSGNTITYNYQNLPQAVTGAANITYTYDADGRKLRKVLGSGAAAPITEYIDGIQYGYLTGATPAIAFIQTGEGRAVPSGAFSYNYEYDMIDHLGSSRLTFDTQSGSASKVQNNDYYPFGMVSSSGPPRSPQNNYLYNKKELQETGQYDYGARSYDPVVARWMSMDPMAENYHKWSGYNYALNNPIRFTDPDGMSVEEEAARLQRLVNQANAQTAANEQYHAFVAGFAGFSFGGEGSSTKMIGLLVANARGADTVKKAENHGGQRPDADGFITKDEAINWWKNGNGVTLNANLNQLDLSKVYASSFSGGIGSRLVINFATQASLWDNAGHTMLYDQGWVYGNITLKLVGPNEVRAFQDTYDFDYKSNWNPLNWLRNLDTVIGASTNGNGIPYHINLNGSAYIQSQPLPVK